LTLFSTRLCTRLY